MTRRVAASVCAIVLVCSCDFTDWRGFLDISNAEDIVRLVSDDKECGQFILINKSRNKDGWIGGLDSCNGQKGTKTDMSSVASGMTLLHYGDIYVLGFERDSDVRLKDLSPFFHNCKSLRKIDFGNLDLGNVRTYDEKSGRCFLEGTSNVDLRAENLKFPIFYFLDGASEKLLPETYVYGETTKLADAPARGGQCRFTNWYGDEGSLRSNPKDLADCVQSIGKSDYGVKKFYGQFNKYGIIRCDLPSHLDGSQIYKNEIEFSYSETDATEFFAGDSITVKLQPEAGFLIPEGSVRINGVPMQYFSDGGYYRHVVPENPPEALDLAVTTRQYVEYHDLSLDNCAVNITRNSSVVSQGTKFNVGDVILIDVTPSSNHGVNDSKDDSILVDGRKPEKISENKYRYSITGNESLQFGISIHCEESWAHTLSATKCTVQIKRNGASVQPGVPLFKNDDLTLNVAPDGSHELDFIFLNGNPLQSSDGVCRYSVSGSEPAHSLNFEVSCRKYTKLNVLEHDGCSVSVKRSGAEVSSGDSLYIGDELDISVAPDSSFMVDSVRVNGNSLVENGEWFYSYAITGNEPEKLGVSIRTKKYICLEMGALSNCIAKVYRGSDEITDAERLVLGDLIKVAVTPDDHYYVKEISANNHTSVNRPELQFSLDGEDMSGSKLSVGVMTDNYHTLSVTKPDAVLISMTDGNGNEITPSSECRNGDEIRIKLTNPNDFYTRKASVSGLSPQEFTASDDYTISYLVKQSDPDVITVSITCLDYIDFSSCDFTIASVRPYLADAVEFTVAAASDWTSVATGVGENSVRLRRDGKKTYLLLGDSVSKIEESSYYQLFKGLPALKVLDLSKLSFNSCTNVTEMFSGCSSLETIYVLAMPSSPGYGHSAGTFAGCVKLSGKYSGGSCAFDPNKITGDYARIATSNSWQFGYFTKK